MNRKMRANAAKQRARETRRARDRKAAQTKITCSDCGGELAVAVILIPEVVPDKRKMH